jgi:hypothetical protein
MTSELTRRLAHAPVRPQRAISPAVRHQPDAQACTSIIGADVRPNWKERPGQESLKVATPRQPLVRQSGTILH